MARTLSSSAQNPRDPSEKWNDHAALQAIAQAAVDVELFTIPLYMTSLYSIEGMHPITGRGSDLYLGRLWPGAKASADAATPNARAFNIVFSVFIQEMLHLQMAANMASVVGIHPDFTGLQDKGFGWTCYGPDLTVIPHIVDLRDTTNDSDLKVNVGPLDEDRVRLFLAIEQPEADARANIRPDKIGDYFPQAPFDGWQRGDPLPMFGTIGWMYQCYYDYLNLRYSDGSTLWEMVWEGIQKTPPVQNDLFNSVGAGHPMREFLGFNTQIATTYPDIALSQMVAMMDAITDQGEGSELDKPEANLLAAVLPRYCPDEDALRSDYPSYDDKGVLIPSADAAARFQNDGQDHYERFAEVQSLIRDPAFSTWATAGKAGRWQGSDLKTADYDQNPHNETLPSADDIAAAMNRMAQNPKASHQLLSQAAVGAIAGVTTVLNDYWNPPGGKAVLFPYPSMTGSGDRMAIAWAVLGQCPDLSAQVGMPDENTLYHACQGLDFAGPGKNDCAAVEVFHSCKGSNHCHAQGGCGFVQATTGGGNCSSSGGGGGGGGSCGGGGNCGSTALSLRAYQGTCGLPPVDSTLYSAPSDNKCQGFGGCAVPISDCQLYPKSGKMQVYKFVTNDGKITSVPIDEIEFAYGEKVADIAYKAFSTVITKSGGTAPPQPDANDLRLVFPPST
ncbi:MAG: ferritin-like domain-containing protein [Allosphingosinicella sp.]